MPGLVYALAACRQGQRFSNGTPAKFDGICLRELGLGVDVVEFKEASDVADWQRMKKDSVDDGKDGGVEAESECQGDDGDGAEAAILQQHASGEADVFGEIVEPAVDPGGAAVVFYQRGVAESAIGGVGCGGGENPARSAQYSRQRADGVGSPDRD